MKLDENTRLLIIEARNFGDAIIKLSLINSVGVSFPNITIDVLTHKQLEAFFKKSSYINNVFITSFPIATYKNYNLFNLLKMLVVLRRQKYDLCIDNTGDFREIFINWLINPKFNVTVVRQPGHPFNHLIRKGFRFLANKVIRISSDELSIYENQKTLITALNLPIYRDAVFDSVSSYIVQDNLIGIHPFASQNCKMWGHKSWITLIQKLARLGFRIWIFCSPNEKSKAIDLYKDILQEGYVEIKSGNLQNFFNHLAQVMLLVGLDSFSVHAAYALKVKRIMLCGANDYRVWAPPGTIVLSNGTSCRYFPCYNIPQCTENYDSYFCIRRISVMEVYDSVLQQLNAKGD